MLFKSNENDRRNLSSCFGFLRNEEVMKECFLSSPDIVPISYQPHDPRYTVFLIPIVQVSCTLMLEAPFWCGENL